MAAKKKKKVEKHHDLFEDPESLREGLSRVEHYIETNKNLFFTLVGLLLVAVVSILGYRYYVSQQDNKAQNEMFQAVYYFEADSLDLALNGDGNNLGFLDIIDLYGRTKAANLAEFYAGTSFLKKGNYNQAIQYLKDFSSDDLLLQARAYSLIGDAYMQLGNFDEAVNYYKKAADYNPNKYFTPQYLMKAALAYEKLNNYKSAKEMYDRIIKDFATSNEYQEAKKQSSRLQGLIAS